MRAHVCYIVRARVPACVRGRECAYVRVCVRACVLACVCVDVKVGLSLRACKHTHKC